MNCAPCRTDAPDVMEASHCKSATSVTYPRGECLFKQVKTALKKSLQLSLLFLCFAPHVTWCVVCGEGEELRSDWTNKGGELASPLSMADRSVTASRVSNGAKGAGEPQNGNPFSSSTALSPLALPIQAVAPSLALSPSPENNCFPYSPPLEQSKLYQQCVSRNMVLPPYASSRAQISVRPEVHCA